MNKLDRDIFEKIVPKRFKSMITDELIDELNNVIKDKEIAELYRENLLKYSSLLRTNGCRLDSYLNAIKFVTYKSIGDNNLQAYIKTFPDRYKQMMDDGKADNYINAIVSAYVKGEMVQNIIAKTMIPMHVLGRDLHIEALEHSANMMYNAKSEMVKQKAAETVLKYTQAPEESKVEIDLSVKDQKNIVDRYEEALKFAAEKQLEMINKGFDAKDVANIKLIDVKEVEEKENG